MSEEKLKSKIEQASGISKEGDILDVAVDRGMVEKA